MKEADGLIRVEVTDKLPEKARTLRADGGEGSEKRGAAAKKTQAGSGKSAETVKKTAVRGGEKAGTGTKTHVVAFLDEEEAPDSRERTAEKKSPAKKSTNGAGVKGKSTKTGGKTAKESGKASRDGRKSAKESGKTTRRVKARKPNEKITPASIYRKMIAFGKVYQVENEQDFIEAARIYAEEAGLIDQMRDRLAEDGLTVMKTYKTGDVEVAHPLLSELPRHVESANKCLTTIGNMISDRGAKKERAARDLDAFRLH